ncbi:MAG: dipeptidase [Candidatus Competibacteraceae bacterium]|nr:dipeptidase [Candidatus Competibacteraceae bacterium]
MQDEMIVIDGLQYSNWDRNIFEQYRTGGVTAVHVTIAYWENARETLLNIGRWNRLFERHRDLIMPVRSPADIHEARRLGKTGIIYGFQNCSPIEDDISLIEIFRDLGVWIMQLSYNNQSLLATGCYEENDPGITRFGKVAIREMNRVGMIVDMSHSAERSTLEAIELSSRPIVISHANPSSFHPARRNKSDTVLKALAESGGLLGFSAYPFHLRNGSDCTLEEFCDMVARSADLMGIDHIGIGTDLCLNQPYEVLEWMRTGRWNKEADYGEGSASNRDWPKAPSWFRDSTGFPNLTQGLLKKGFSQQEAAKIMGGNWLALFEKSVQPLARQ